MNIDVSGQSNWNKFKKTSIFETSHWRSICDVSLTLKQGRRTDHGHWARKPWVWIDQFQCQRAFRHFLNLLNRAVYGTAVRRYGKRVRIIPVIEKEMNGRWHFHAAIEPPRHINTKDFETLIQDCWQQVDWAYREALVRSNADKGWIDYMLKPTQKSGLEAWSDCIDWNCFHNPIADA